MRSSSSSPILIASIDEAAALTRETSPTKAQKKAMPEAWSCLSGWRSLLAFCQVPDEAFQEPMRQMALASLDMISPSARASALRELCSDLASSPGMSASLGWALSQLSPEQIRSMAETLVGPDLSLFYTNSSRPKRSKSSTDSSRDLDLEAALVSFDEWGHACSSQFQQRSLSFKAGSRLSLSGLAALGEAGLLQAELAAWSRAFDEPPAILSRRPDLLAAWRHTSAHWGKHAHPGIAALHQGASHEDLLRLGAIPPVGSSPAFDLGVSLFALDLVEESMSAAIARRLPFPEPFATSAGQALSALVDSSASDGTFDLKQELLSEWLLASGHSREQTTPLVDQLLGDLTEQALSAIQSLAASGRHAPLSRFHFTEINLALERLCAWGQQGAEFGISGPSEAARSEALSLLTEEMASMQTASDRSPHLAFQGALAALGSARKASPKRSAAL